MAYTSCMSTCSGILWKGAVGTGQTRCQRRGNTCAMMCFAYNRYLRHLHNLRYKSHLLSCEKHYFWTGLLLYQLDKLIKQESFEEHITIVADFFREMVWDKRVCKIIGKEEFWLFSFTAGANVVSLPSTQC